MYNIRRRLRIGSVIDCAEQYLNGLRSLLLQSCYFNDDDDDTAAAAAAHDHDDDYDNNDHYHHLHPI